MFEITDETKLNAVEAIKAVFVKHGQAVPDDSILLEAIDDAVAVVKAQFGF